MGLKELLKGIASELEKEGIDYMIIGGQAVLIYGEPRLTRDIDVVIGKGIEGFEKILEVISNLRLNILPENPLEFVKKTMVLPCFSKENGLRVDFIFSFSPYEREALKRVNVLKIDDVYVRYASVEDIIIHKMIAGRERDFEDIKSILVKNRSVDEKYIKKWLLEFEKIINRKLFRKFKKIKKEIFG